MDSGKEFVEFKKDGAWQYFLRENKGQCATCKLCKAELKTVGGSTKGLHVHLVSKHDINLLKKKPAEDTTDYTETANGKPSSSKQLKRGDTNTLNKYLMLRDQNSLPATLSRMTACDGIPFLVFAQSNDLRKGLSAMGFRDIPKSPNGIHQVVMDHGLNIRAQVKAELAILKKQGVRFSVSFDEWTSNRNRRYMNVNVHESGDRYWNLGLIRAAGTMPAEQCVKLLIKKLEVYGLSLDADIVCIVTDGASVMKKVGTIISAEQQLCYAHGVQLAVLDVLYKHRSSASSMELDETSEQDDHTLESHPVVASADGDEAELHEGMNYIC
jgi:hypothetical protein